MDRGFACQDGGFEPSQTESVEGARTDGEAKAGLHSM